LLLNSRLQPTEIAPWRFGGEVGLDQGAMLGG
jgi:hypothetical protein